jgi:hypothetical protein
MHSLCWDPGREVPAGRRYRENPVGFFSLDPTS